MNPNDCECELFDGSARLRPPPAFPGHAAPGPAHGRAAAPSVRGARHRESPPARPGMTQRTSWERRSSSGSAASRSASRRSSRPLPPAKLLHRERPAAGVGLPVDVPRRFARHVGPQAEEVIARPAAGRDAVVAAQQALRPFRASAGLRINMVDDVDHHGPGRPRPARRDTRCACPAHGTGTGRGWPRATGRQRSACRRR